MTVISNVACVFHMPRNPKYKCPRTREMFDPLNKVWYCKVHDPHRENRCQAFRDFQGVQCTELATFVDEKTKKRYCKEHTPRCHVSIVPPAPSIGEVKEKFEKDDGTEINETLENVDANAYASDELTDRYGTLVAQVHDQLSIAEQGSESEISLESQKNSNLAKSFLDMSFQGKPNLPVRPVETKTEKSQRPQLPTRQISLGSILSSIDDENNADGRIASMYFLCNICLEKHSTSLMREVEGCGHQYIELCLQKALRVGNKRRYNCSICQTWIADVLKARGED